MTTTYVIPAIDGTARIDAHEYRQDGEGDLYLYRTDADDPVAHFPAGMWRGIWESDAGSFVPNE